MYAPRLTLLLCAGEVFAGTIPGQRHHWTPVVRPVAPVVDIPDAYQTTNHTIGNLEGFEYHYRIPDPVTGQIVEDFKVIFVSGFADDEPELLPRSATLPELTSLEARDTWYCNYVEGCFDPVVAGIQFTSSQVAAWLSALANDLRANGYAKAKTLVAGQIYQFAFGLAVNGFYDWITSKAKDQGQGTNDVCIVATMDQLEAMISKLQDNCKQEATSCNDGDNRPCGYAHYAYDPDKKIEGVGQIQTFKPTGSSTDYKDVSSCTSLT